MATTTCGSTTSWPGGNSGVFIRVPKDGDHHGRLPASRFRCSTTRQAIRELKPYQYRAASTPSPRRALRVSRPAGEWNSLEINARGSGYRVTHNGVTVVDASEEKFPGLKERLVKGFLGLQNHSTKVWFRNIRLGPAME